MPFVRTKSGHGKHGETHKDVRHENVQPNINGQRIHKRKQTMKVATGNLQIGTGKKIGLIFKSFLSDVDSTNTLWICPPFDGYYSAGCQILEL